MKLIKLVAIAMAATGALAVQAEAAITTTVGAQSISASPSPGCEPKGLWASQLVTSGTLSGTYRYAVTATIAPAAPACPSVELTVPSNSVLALLWNPTPGATGYTVYRGTSDANLAPLAITVNCSAKCFAIDTGAATPTGTLPVFAAPSLLAGDHTDLSVLQSVDYGGSATDSLKTDLIHFPGGLTLDASAPGATCSVSGAAPSLVGSTSLHGTLDSDEDTCPPASLIGSATAVIKTPAVGLTGTANLPVQGDVYRGTPTGSEALRLLIALRPLCSAGSFVAPGSSYCAGALGAIDRELDKVFIGVKGTSVQRSPGVNGIDAELFDVSAGSDQSLPSSLTVRRSSDGVFLAPLDFQIRGLTLTSFGYADQATASTSDDKPFVTLPTCGVSEFASALTTNADATGASASTPFTSFPACPTPPAATPPSSSAVAPKKKKKCKKGRVRKHGKCVKKKR
jgi:hypothetical protein